jgi:hypothetical protein
MAELVDVATSTYDQRYKVISVVLILFYVQKAKSSQPPFSTSFREEATTKIRSYRERNDKESKQHVLEMKEFQRVLHHDEKGHGFMVIKGKQRPLLEDDEVRRSE